MPQLSPIYWMIFPMILFVVLVSLVGMIDWSDEKLESGLKEYNESFNLNLWW